MLSSQGKTFIFFVGQKNDKLSNIKHFFTGCIFEGRATTENNIDISQSAFYGGRGQNIWSDLMFVYIIVKRLENGVDDDDHEDVNSLVGSNSNCRFYFQNSTEID